MIKIHKILQQFDFHKIETVNKSNALTFSLENKDLTITEIGYNTIYETYRQCRKKETKCI